ncbi:uncharacterized protein PGTG_21252 [Puccinia graminis f. sp. tritici CRL 75-36-700-3]|uniref:Uncharacterized protein n=1 Tax=Puccinia graminis f. sp. tritici (strain CRL 75-36-700-3 / race SCCL) TaxID=418459 RepID=H6QQV0_PUCGT|nr:uncharacterized protein PGTG_21252 [Puccinia graminis f. sp. tritici CRL 75-36-700-3]EHS62879.1 hypothetical protein PGTG_21252 [Puccinia graminis f. sp. tritici CRL 75-36-700-3]
MLYEADGSAFILHGKWLQVVRRSSAAESSVGEVVLHGIDEGLRMTGEDVASHKSLRGKFKWKKIINFRKKNLSGDTTCAPCPTITVGKWGQHIAAHLYPSPASASTGGSSFPPASTPSAATLPGVDTQELEIQAAILESLKTSQTLPSRQIHSQQSTSANEAIPLPPMSPPPSGPPHSHSPPHHSPPPSPVLIHATREEEERTEDDSQATRGSLLHSEHLACPSDGPVQDAFADCRSHQTFTDYPQGHTRNTPAHSINNYHENLSGDQALLHPQAYVARQDDSKFPWDTLIIGFSILFACWMKGFFSGSGGD